MPKPKAAPSGGPPPPPPPPGPPPPPANMPPPPKPTAGRGALLSSIQHGAKLKHTQTVDKSAPILSTPKGGSGGGGGGGGGPMGGINPGAVKLRPRGGAPPPSGPGANDDDSGVGPPPPQMGGGGGGMDMNAAILGAKLRKTNAGSGSSSPSQTHAPPSTHAPPMGSPMNAGRGRSTLNSTSPQLAPPQPPISSLGRAKAPSSVGRTGGNVSVKSPPIRTMDDNSAELQSKINELTSELDQVKAENAELKEKISQLESELRSAKSSNSNSHSSSSSSSSSKSKPPTSSAPIKKPTNPPPKKVAPPPPPEPEPEPEPEPQYQEPEPPQVDGKEFRALYDFEAQQEGDLGFKKDDIILVTKQEGSWWEGSLNGSVGSFPNNYVTPC